MLLLVVCLMRWMAEWGIECTMALRRLRVVRV